MVNLRTRKTLIFNPLHLSGFGVKLTVQDLAHMSVLRVTNGREDERQSTSYAFRPRRFPFSGIIVEGKSGYVSLQAFHWLSKFRIPLFIMDYKGNLLSSLLPRSPSKPELREAQFNAAHSPERKFKIARALVQAKVARSIQVLDYLSELHDLKKTVRTVTEQSERLSSARTVRDVRLIEAQVATRYWYALDSMLPKHLCFDGRHRYSANASDPVNASLNYGYGVLKGECLRHVNSAGLESTIGFLHDSRVSRERINHALAHDLMEPFRWLIDLTVMEMFTSNQLDLKDFYFTGDDYTYRFEHDAKLRFIHQLIDHFQKPVQINGEGHSWSMVIQQKTRALGEFLLEPKRELDFIEPSPLLERPIEVA